MLEHTTVMTADIQGPTSEGRSACMVKARWVALAGARAGPRPLTRFQQTATWIQRDVPRGASCERIACSSRLESAALSEAAASTRSRLSTLHKIGELLAPAMTPVAACAALWMARGHVERE